ncbi:cbb3-type cytochrome c oxidase subunit I [Dyadobacter fanqingshengii]|uniref:Cbb3-type cytochrome c oxidase subunit I n=1 Tax=Dyadobacter fanqingshengii TaxID=2906443 RepID=A0A9X1TFP1_9BACT|nr:cbb3-type cytochrome c oxidase subunit I [Dyadobacter fanqingshengii]MCF0039712.1 cbb3-type cytochrome c oxidase subunit I [Dyadobacter fanqingshengii]USJ38525.1 cbb3-type cytochrome c oxidase subunit I [Dyadobacter fanqingshengii]
MKLSQIHRPGLLLVPGILLNSGVQAQVFIDDTSILDIVSLIVLAIAVCVLLLAFLTKELIIQFRKTQKPKGSSDFDQYIKKLNSSEIDVVLKNIKRKKGQLLKEKTLRLVPLLLCFGLNTVSAQTPAASGPLIGHTGIIITIVLIGIPVVGGIFLLFFKILNALKRYGSAQAIAEAQQFKAYLENMENENLETSLRKRKAQLDYRLTNSELAGLLSPEDERGLITHVAQNAALPFVARKKSAQIRPKVNLELSRLIQWYIGCAACWLVFGTTVGEYVGIKFVAPDVDQVSWLSFGRLRPVHTNAVFWGWASLAMLGLGHYVVPRVSNTQLFDTNLGWYALVLINLSVFAGTLCLMAGINNGGGEYREYIWPVMLPFAIGLVLTLYNFLKTIANRTTKEIYISNWYIVASIIFAITITVVAYLPFWQNGLGETIVQGYYMHQGVGMWFMLFTLGVVYYFLPQQLNKPIYSYSLGILAFWTQILFYTTIGTHHFVFSSIAWWLQTVAIVGSAGMIIPVVAGTTNFVMTFKNAWFKVPDSYTLPFFLTGIVFYFTGSLQGTAEAFRSTNLMWHFTDFTVAHSHLTMYGIICFFLWAGIYAVVPRLTGLEPPQITVGAHFWLALIGLLFYTIPLMYGSTLRGLMWMEERPFIDSVVFMAPFWLWRAIGGSLMWLSHLFFAYNMYRMIVQSDIIDMHETIFKPLPQEHNA